MELDQDLSAIVDKSELRDLLRRTYPKAPEGRIRSFLGQIWIFVKTMQAGDWVGLPSKTKRVIHFGEIAGVYQFNAHQEARLRHSRVVKWFAPNVPRSKLSQDILYGFGALATICGISRNDAEARIR